MNKKIFLIIVFGFLFLTGCGNTVQNNTTEKDTKAPVSVSPDVNNNNLIFNIFKSVLENNINFYSVDTNDKVNLKDFLTNEQIYGTTLKATHFTIIDMDGDKIPEIVLELADKGNNPVCYEVLHFINNEVNGYNIVYRGLENLKTDGTFIYSNGAADNGCGKLSFASSECITNTLGYSMSSEGEGEPKISYFINNKPVTKELFHSFIKEEQGKRSVVWYEFSQKNIENELSANP